MCSIRRLVDDTELHLLFPLFKEDAQAIGVGWDEVDKKRLWMTFYHCLSHGAIFVAERNGQIIGLHVLMLVEAFWGNKQTLHNLIYYVSPEHRSSTAGKALLRAAIEEAQRLRVSLEIKVHSFESNERKDAFFNRYGFKKIGHAYQLEE